MITSPDNPKLKRIRRLLSSSRFRREEQAFVIEGVRLVEEALAAGWQAEYLLSTEGLSQRGQHILQEYAASGAAVDQVSQALMRGLSDTKTPQGLLAVLAYNSLPVQQPLDFVFIPDGVRDPGNLGAMLRTAAAAAVQAVISPPGTVDPFAPKVLRAGMGAHFKLPILSLSWDELLMRLQSLQVCLADSREGLPYTSVDFHQPTALVVSGEIEGTGALAGRIAVTRVHIPMPGGSESLNAAIAAGILLFEIARQKNLNL